MQFDNDTSSFRRECKKLVDPLLGSFVGMGRRRMRSGPHGFIGLNWYPIDNFFISIDDQFEIGSTPPKHILFRKDICDGNDRGFACKNCSDRLFNYRVASSAKVRRAELFMVGQIALAQFGRTVLTLFSYRRGFLRIQLALAGALLSSNAYCWGHLLSISHGQAEVTLTSVTLRTHKINFCIWTDLDSTQIDPASIEQQVRLAITMWLQPAMQIVGLNVQISRVGCDDKQLNLKVTLNQ